MGIEWHAHMVIVSLGYGVLVTLLLYKAMIVWMLWEGLFD